MKGIKKELMTFRVSNNEKSIIENKAKASNMSKSQYIRQHLNLNNLGNNGIKNEVTMTTETVCNILTHIQMMRQLYPKVDFEELEGKVAELCRL